VGLDAAALAEVFPFHFVVGGDGRVEQVGPSLAKLAPALLGAAPADHFEHHRGQAALDFDAIAAAAPAYVLLRHTATRLIWRGQTLRTNERLVFTGAPWVAAADELRPTGLGLDDFALHDPIAEYLTLLQEKHTALHDATQLSRDLRAAQQQLEEQLRETQSERRRLSALIETVPWGVCVEHADGRIATVNAPFCRLFGLDTRPDDLVGRDADSLTQDVVTRVADADGFRDGTRRRRTEGAQWLGELIELRNGRVLERDYVPVTDRDGRLGHLWQLRDVTERQQAAATLEDARQRAEAANTAKSEFLAMMSHEMRTPLGVIVGIAELLRGEPSEDVRGDLVQRLSSNSRSLLQLIDASLDFARLEKRQLDVQLQPMAVDELLDETIDSMGPAAAQRGLQLLAAVAPETPRETLADRPRLRQILINLIHNAIKFTDGAEVRVDACAQPSPSGAPGVLWTVRDQGPGIPAERQAQIFERFVRAEPSGSSRSGTGLGLAICRELCHAMGGEIRIDSDVGRGTTFSVWLPHAAPADPDPAAMPLRGHAAAVHAASPWLRACLADQLRRLGATATEQAAPDDAPPQVALEDPSGREQVFEVGDAGGPAPLQHPVTQAALTDALGLAAQPQQAAADRVAHAATVRQLRILLVDDDRDSVDIHSLVLAQLGASVVAADGVEAALDRLQREPFDLVLTDLRMPGGGGLELIARADAACSERAWPRPPVVVLSAEALAASRERARQRGASGYVTKPTDPEQLRGVLEEHADRRPLVLASIPDGAERARAGAAMAELADHRFVPCASPADVERLLDHYPVALALLDATDPPSAALLAALSARGVRVALANAAALPRELRASLDAAELIRGSLDAAGMLDRARALLPEAAAAGRRRPRGLPPS